jgi:hypothetical protein
LALLEDVFKINPVTGVVVSIGVVLLGPIMLPVVGQILRPAVKAAYHRTPLQERSEEEAFVGAGIGGLDRPLA